MAYIYKIYNDINDKIYIGKTLTSLEERFKRHLYDSKRDSFKNRPLYKAMNKYGINHFYIQEIEQCSESEVNEREKYWIEILESFKYGYNATHGGDGKHYADYNLIYALWNEGKNNLEIQQILGYDSHTVKTALINKGVSEKERNKRGRQQCYKAVAMLDKDTKEFLRIFPSIQEAYNFLKKQHSGHIAEVCKGKRKSAYGYSWRYLNGE